VHTTPNGIVPGILNPVARPTVTITGLVSSTGRTQLRSRGGRGPALNTSPSEFTLVLRDPIDRVTDLSVSNFNSRGVIWAITPKRGTNTMCISPAPQEPQGFSAPCGGGASDTCHCGTPACGATTKADCTPCDCDWVPTTRTCEQPEWMQLCAPPMAYPTQTALLQWLQRYTPIGWQWVISPDGYTGVQPYLWSIPAQTPPTPDPDALVSTCPSPASMEWCAPPTLRLCFGSDRPLNPSLGWILGFRDRCYTFLPPTIIHVANLLMSTDGVAITWEITGASAVIFSSCAGTSVMAHIGGSPGPGVVRLAPPGSLLAADGYLVAVEALLPTYHWVWFPARPSTEDIAIARASWASGTYDGYFAHYDSSAGPPAAVNFYKGTQTSFVAAAELQATALVNPTPPLPIPQPTQVAACPEVCADPCGPNLYSSPDGALPVMNSPTYQAAEHPTAGDVTPQDIVAMIKPSRTRATSTQVIRATAAGTTLPSGPILPPPCETAACFCAPLIADEAISSGTAIGLVTQSPPSPTPHHHHHDATPTGSPLPVGEPIPGTMHNDFVVPDPNPNPPSSVTPCDPVPLPQQFPCDPYFAEGKYDLWGTETFALCIDDFQTRGSAGGMRTSLSGQDCAPNAIGFLTPQSPPSSPTAGNMGGELQLSGDASRSYTGPVKIARLGFSVSDSRGVPVDLVDDFSVQVTFTSAYDPA
jgi:hypothetical protein